LARLIYARFLWYLGVGVLAAGALVLHTGVSPDTTLVAIAAYLLLSVLAMPGVAALAVARARASRAWRPPRWPAWAVAALGLLLLASHRVVAGELRAEMGVFLLLIGVDIALACRECELLSARLRQD